MKTLKIRKTGIQIGCLLLFYLVCIFIFYFVSLSNAQLLEETRRLLQYQGLAGEQQPPSRPQEFPSSQSVPSLSPAGPSITQPLQTPQQQIKTAEPPGDAVVTILPSDVLIIQLPGENHIIGVDKEGYANLPYVGIKKVEGLKELDIRRMIREATNQTPEVRILTSPKIDASIQFMIPQYVNIVGDFNLPTVSPPGSLSFCIAQARGLSPTATGKIYIHQRDRVWSVDFYSVIKKDPSKLNIYIPAGSTIYAEKAAGHKVLENTGSVFSRLRDIALTLIAFIELDTYGRQRGWW